ncbi:DUF6306 domain-containing protein [Sphingomonas sp. KC8]|uniref:DUF6306 domain-containing protein n=1 Tax=Sphingomonas sp. KC8 TaxID=1030157 RepID=UPI0002489836|nr:DUF6306 domain-containing protein [Sphingomonas sp. KC8]ARS29440.1 hypothetical protein KC8_19405 [Sphingomonas sp. KC8]
MMVNEPTSSACYASEADDIYMGFAGREEILAALNGLLEAERAGARIALASAKSASDPDYAELMQSVRADEARWCAMLSRQIRRLGAAASRKTGAFCEKALAIPDPLERLAFLNRGQAWVVRKLKALTPRIRDEALHADLREMLESHRVNIDRAAAHLEAEH